MSAFLQNLRQPEYVHVLLNHLPLTGLFAAVTGLIAALVMRNRAAILLGMGLVSLFSLSAWPVSGYGGQAYDRVYSMADKDGDAYLSHHKELADHWIILYYVTAAVGVAGMLAAWKWPGTLWPFALALVLLSLASLVAGGVIAEVGGKVRHTEFRVGKP